VSSRIWQRPCCCIEEQRKVNLDAQRNRLGYLYRIGKGVPEDLREAAKWYEMASMEFTDRSMLSYFNRMGSDRYTEDSIITPRVKVRRVFGSLIRIANKKKAIRSTNGNEGWASTLSPVRH
jgi:hypothetical protein